MEVRTRQFPTKCAEYPTPLEVLKLKRKVVKALYFSVKKTNRLTNKDRVFPFQY